MCTEIGRLLIGVLFKTHISFLDKSKGGAQPKSVYKSRSSLGLILIMSQSPHPQDRVSQLVTVTGMSANEYYFLNLSFQKFHFSLNLWSWAETMSFSVIVMCFMGAGCSILLYINIGLIWTGAAC
jgi:hypothetical protein